MYPPAVCWSPANEHASCIAQEIVMDVLVLASDFLWDTATAAHQAEGRNRNTNWCVSKQAGLVPHCSSHAIGWVGSAH
jgi:hypothetical protein